MNNAIYLSMEAKEPSREEKELEKLKATFAQVNKAGRMVGNPALGMDVAIAIGDIIRTLSMEVQP